MAILDRVRKGWNAFFNQPEPLDLDFTSSPIGTSYGVGGSPSRPRLRYSNEKSIVSSIYTRISMDVAAVVLKHVKLDEQDRFKETIKSALNDCLTFEANLDQSPRAFRQDIVMTLFDKGVAAIVPVDTAVDPTTNHVFDIYTVRVGEIVKWYPKHVRVDLWKEDEGKRKEVTLEKRMVAIVENPLYMVMNEPNSTLQRLIRKLNLLDAVDEQSGSGKLDIIIQLPYVIKSEARRDQAEKRRRDIEFQLKGSQYGIAYTGSTEKITQLNRPAENNLMGQIEYLVKTLYGQLGITEEVMLGTASEEVMINYINRTVEPIVVAIVEAMQRAFIGPVATKDQQRIAFFKEPFKLVPIKELAEIADKFTRNEILTSNEIRGVVGFQPAPDPKADQLVNSNMPQGQTGVPAPAAGPSVEDLDSIMNETFDGIESEIDKLLKE